MERDLNWYMNTARHNENISSDRNLARELGVSSVAGWRDPYRPRIPEHAVMLKLSAMAGVPKHIALLDRDIWDATYKAPEAVPIYEKILKQFPKYAASALMGCLLYGADFDTSAMAKGTISAQNAASHTLNINYAHFMTPFGKSANIVDHTPFKI